MVRRATGTALSGVALAFGACAFGVLACLAAEAQAASPREPEAQRTPLMRSIMQEALAREHGESGMPRDPVRAAGLYCQAARLGDVEAHYSLGWMLANGRGVERDDSGAAALFAIAAAQGHGAAQRALERLGEGASHLPDCMNTVAERPPEPEPANSPQLTEEQRAMFVLARVEAAKVGFARAMRGAPDIAYDNLPPAKRRIAALIRWLAPRYGVDPRLALAVATAESNFDPGARSPKDAQGVMQLIPATAERFRVRNTWDPFDNISGGLAYLRWLLAYYRGNVTHVLAAYNAGEGAVDRYRGVPPFAETREYVRRIQLLYPEPTHPFSAVVNPRVSPLAIERPAGNHRQ